MVLAVCRVDGCERNCHGEGLCNPHYKRFKRHGDPLVQVRVRQGFWDYVRKSETGCWEWGGYVDPRSGYGRYYGVSYGFGPTALAHRVAWFLAHGKLDSEACVLHKCDNPPCVRPDHLFLGTRADNSADMVAKGRAGNGAHLFASRTHGTRNAHAKMTEELVVEMRKRALAGENYRELAVAYGISESRANAIIIGNGWRHVWPYGGDYEPTGRVNK